MSNKGMSWTIRITSIVLVLALVGLGWSIFDSFVVSSLIGLFNVGLEILERMPERTK